jgi:Caspase domain
MGRKLALLIGNGMYANLPRLKKHRADVRYLARALRDPNIGAFDNVEELTDKSFNTIRREIERFFIEGKTSEDLLLLYLTGHGEMDRKGLQWYFTSNNTDKERLSYTAIPASFIRELMNLTHSQRLIVILDACYASAFIEGAKGGAVTEVATQQLAGYGRAILAAAGSHENAWEGHESIPLSTFTYHLVQGLTTGAADRDKDGFITVDEWFDYTDEQVRRERSDQTPRKDVRTQRGKLIIARNPYREAVIDTSNQSQGRDINQPISVNEGEESSSEVITPQTFSVGGREMNIIILARGYYSPQEIQCFYDRTYLQAFTS